MEGDESQGSQYNSAGSGTPNPVVNQNPPPAIPDNKQGGDVVQGQGDVGKVLEKASKKLKKHDKMIELIHEVTKPMMDFVCQRNDELHENLLKISENMKKLTDEFFSFADWSKKQINQLDHRFDNLHESSTPRQNTLFSTPANRQENVIDDDFTLGESRGRRDTDNSRVKLGVSLPISPYLKGVTERPEEDFSRFGDNARARGRSKVVPPINVSLPTFDGDNKKLTPHLFCKRFIDYAKALEETPDSILERDMPIALKGEARKWWEFHEGFTSYAQFKKEFMKYFQPQEYDINCLKDIEVRYQGEDETLSQYLINIKGMYDSLSILVPMQEQVLKAYGNMHPNYQQYVENKEYSSLHDMYEDSFRIEKSVQHRNRWKPPSAFTQAEPMYGYQKNSIDGRKVKLKSGLPEDENGENTDSNMARPFIHKTCWHCGSDEHLADGCNVKPTARNPPKQAPGARYSSQERKATI